MNNMRYLQNFNNLNDPRQIHRTRVDQICEMSIPDPDHGDMKLSVFPFENTGDWVNLPEGFKKWEGTLNEILKHVPLQEGANTHYVTIDSKFFTQDDYLRREGIHIDGNFCVDPEFSFQNLSEKASWGGASPRPRWGGVNLKEVDDAEEEEETKASWGGVNLKESKRYSTNRKDYMVKEDNSHVEMDWVLPYDITIPIGEYVSEKKGGILSVSSEVGCHAWGGEYRGEVLGEGAYDNMTDQLTDDDKVIFEKNNLYFMSSNTPHETLVIDKGTRRTFMRVTLNHEYLNEQIGK